MDWGKLLALIAAGLLVWFLIRSIRSNPEMMSKQNISKSFSTMGFLALGLIAFITFLIVMLRM